VNPDQIFMAPAHPTIQTVYGLLTGGQGSPKAQQIIGMAVLFNEACDALKLDKGQMLDAAKRLAANAQDHYSIELRALREYITQELGTAA